MRQDLEPSTGNEEKDHLWGVRGSPDWSAIQGIQKDNKHLISLRKKSMRGRVVNKT